ncbi:hypothetical protein BJX61DRAFT_18233 [Aspergillus egyptiacus]|nr:hypothetical protein BJX61DRAFT_18233 [Aspergillus egyptiacus]
MTSTFTTIAPSSTSPLASPFAISLLLPFYVLSNSPDATASPSTMGKLAWMIFPVLGSIVDAHGCGHQTRYYKPKANGEWANLTDYIPAVAKIVYIRGLHTQKHESVIDVCIGVGRLTHYTDLGEVGNGPT